MAELVGKTLKDFRILRRLGRGAMAEVYLAQQLSLGRGVALKILNAELAREPNYVRRFHHEARAAAALVHANIVQIYEVGEADGVHYIAQECVQGRNLGEVIRSRGSLSPTLTLDILRQVAAALTKAASQGIVHRDIKPENIMVAAATGEVKVADFGLARVQGDGATTLTQIGVTMGTPLYMSPEQIEGRQLDSRSDIYSLGVTAYHMLAGEPPFVGDSPLAVAVQHLNQPPTPLATRRPELPSRFVEVVERMMAKKPAERFADPRELLNSLNALAAEGAEQGWLVRERDTDKVSLAQTLRAADARADATTRLDVLMRTAALARRSTRSDPGQLFRWFAAVVVGCALLGLALAALTSPTSLLQGADAGTPKGESVLAQLYHAKMVDTEEAWRAVENHFPDADGYYHNLARQGLAYYYLTRSGEYEKALAPLEELTLASEPTFQAFGYAGLVVAYAHVGDDEQAYYANQKLSTEMRATLEEQVPRMATLLNEALDELATRAL